MTADSHARPQPRTQTPAQPAVDTSDVSDGLAFTIRKTRLDARSDGPELTDQYGRTAAKCRAASARARVHARALLAAKADLESGDVTLGRNGTEKRAKQLGLLAAALDAAAGRDVGFAGALEELE